MKNKLILLISFLAALQAGPALAQQQGTPAKPKLIIGIVVDQMRYDYLSRYWNKFGEGGFKKLAGEGYVCKNANYSYVPTYTAPGHASIFTGTTPSVNGIVANEWYDRNTGDTVYCVQDTSCRTVGSNSPSAGMMSPANLFNNTIGDELKVSWGKQCRVIGISLKDRGAILPAGHMGDAAYWYDGESGNWVSSTYYMKELPQWVSRFNEKKETEKYLSRPWNTLMPMQQYTESTPDDVPFETPFPGENRPVFPHDLPSIRKSPALLRSTPFGNTLTKDFAVEAIRQEKLGQDNFPDVLIISFSSTDYVGHQFGPNSVETEDTYLRLDRDIAGLLTFIDSQAGKKNVLVFLTADHGASPCPAYMESLHAHAGVFRTEHLLDSLRKFLNARFSINNWMSCYMNQSIYLDYKLMEQNNVNPEDMERSISAFLSNAEGVALCTVSGKLKTMEYRDGLNGYVQRGYSKTRSGDVIITLQPNWIEWGRTGTTHGSCYSYDTHVPLLWYGWKVNRGACDNSTDITSIAPSLSEILGIPAPGGCIAPPISLPLR